jgi:hypothetical protein
MPYDLSPTILTLKWLRKEIQSLREDGIVLPKHVGAIVYVNKEVYNFGAFS